jgi:2-hydroxychromene-2-carboxylate isomerase
MKRNPRVFFSFRSPFSWMALERMHRVLPGAYELIEFIPYWEPDERTELALRRQSVVLPYTPMSKAKHLYILADTKRLAAEMGLRLVWPVDGENPWWEVSHLGWILANQMGCGAQFYRTVTEARWLHGEDVCSAAVIRRLADSVGLDGAEIANAIEDPDIRAQGVRCLVEAYEDDIFGVPYFRIGHHRFWGIDRVDRFIEQVQAACCASFPPPTSAVRNGSVNGGVSRKRSHAGGDLAGPYDYDTAGGCG